MQILQGITDIKMYLMEIDRGSFESQVMFYCCATDHFKGKDLTKVR